MVRLRWLVLLGLLATSCTSGEAAEPVPPVEASTSIAPATTSSSTTTTSIVAITTTTTTVPIPIDVAETPRSISPAPVARTVDGFVGDGVVTIAAGGAALYEEVGAAAFVTAREGLVFPAQGMQGDWIEIFTSCDARALVHSSEVLAEPPSASMDIGPGFDFGLATIVLDPGHGGPWNTGASSPDGVAEKTVNLDIARRVRDLLNQPHTVDWATGTIFVGEEVPAAGWVLMTRDGDGSQGDYEAGLLYRSFLANAANADAMVAIHNNAGWEVRIDTPGSDVFYQSQIEESRRFAKIMVEELLRSFAPFEADWVGALERGARSRLSPRDDNPQYYGILRRSEMPTVITEGAYIGNQSEADLLATVEFRQAYAEAIYRALVRFLTTDDLGEGIDLDPVIWRGDAGSGDARPECQIPSQEDS